MAPSAPPSSASASGKNKKRKNKKKQGKKHAPSGTTAASTELDELEGAALTDEDTGRTENPQEKLNEDEDRQGPVNGVDMVEKPDQDQQNGVEIPTDSASGPSKTPHSEAPIEFDKSSANNEEKTISPARKTVQILETDTMKGLPAAEDEAINVSNMQSENDAVVSDSHFLESGEEPASVVANGDELSDPEGKLQSDNPPKLDVSTENGDAPDGIATSNDPASPLEVTPISISPTPQDELPHETPSAGTENAETSTKLNDQDTSGNDASRLWHDRGSDVVDRPSEEKDGEGFAGSTMLEHPLHISHQPEMMMEDRPQRDFKNDLSVPTRSADPSSSENLPDQTLDVRTESPDVHPRSPPKDRPVLERPNPTPTYRFDLGQDHVNGWSDSYPSSPVAGPSSHRLDDPTPAEPRTNGDGDEEEEHALSFSENKADEEAFFQLRYRHGIDINDDHGGKLWFDQDGLGSQEWNGTWPLRRPGSSNLRQNGFSGHEDGDPGGYASADDDEEFGDFAGAALSTPASISDSKLYSPSTCSTPTTERMPPRGTGSTTACIGHSKRPSLIHSSSYSQSPAQRSLSRSSSMLLDADEGDDAPDNLISGDITPKGSAADRDMPQQPPFAWRTLKRASQIIFTDERFGNPTSFAAKGVIATGTDNGQTLVFDYLQQLIAVCGGSKINETAVTALDISFDDLFIACGHADGNIYIYDLANPPIPARTAPALSYAAVSSGRREGHLEGVAVTKLSFVGHRHTAVVSGDEHGHAFWRSMGKVLGIESNDVIRLYGRHGRSRLLDVRPIPRADDALDSLSAILTPTKLIVIGLRPRPRTWYRCTRPASSPPISDGAVAWLRLKASGAIAAYAWGRDVRQLQVNHTIVEEKPQTQFDDGPLWAAPSEVVSLDWFNDTHLLIRTKNSIHLLDRISLKEVEADVLDSAAFAVHRGKLFNLSTILQVATLRIWADKILEFVRAGDFFAAIRLAVAYYTGSASGNRIGLNSENPQEQLLPRIRSLLESAAEYTFSEDRLFDERYMTEGGGIDVQPLFQNFARTVLESCSDLQDMSFAYEVVYDRYESFGIRGIFLTELYDLLEVRPVSVTPPICKALLEVLDASDEPRKIAHVVEHVDAISLDLNSVVRICERRKLWDPLIYVYNVAFRDWRTPLSLVKNDNCAFAYIQAILGDKQYPSLEPLTDPTTAKRQIYEALLEDDLLHHFLQIDAEAMLNALDLAFEDDLLDEQETRGLASRQYIIELLLPYRDPLVQIFLALNIPKYPQFVHLEPPVLDSLLSNLCDCADLDSKDDRELAAESLLSVYRPQGGIRVEQLRRAGFKTILSQVFIQNRRWHDLIELGERPHRALEEALSRGEPGVRKAIELNLLALLDDIQQTALLLDRNLPALHIQAFDSLRVSDQQRQYLRTLLEPQLEVVETVAGLSSDGTPSTHVPPELIGEYVRLLEPHGEHLRFIKTFDGSRQSWDVIAKVCDELDSLDAAIFVLLRLGQNGRAREKIKQHVSLQRQRITKAYELEEPQTNVSAVLVASAKELGIVFTTALEIQEMTNDVWSDVFALAFQCQDLLSGLDLETPRAELQHQVRVTLQLLTSSIPFAELFAGVIERRPLSVPSSSPGHALLSSMLVIYHSQSSTYRSATAIVGTEAFDLFRQLHFAKQSGWRSTSMIACAKCGEALIDIDVLEQWEEKRKKSQPEEATALELDLGSLLVARSGKVYHPECEGA